MPTQASAGTPLGADPDEWPDISTSSPVAGTVRCIRAARPICPSGCTSTAKAWSPALPAVTVKRLVYVETYDDISDAIVRERRIKEWRRDWKIQLIEQENPFWEDLAVSLLGFDPLPTPKESPRRKPGPTNRSGGRSPRPRNSSE